MATRPRTRALLFGILIFAPAVASEVGAGRAAGSAPEAPSGWADRLLHVPYPPTAAPQPTRQATLELVRQDFEELEINRSVIKTPMTIGKQQFKRGLGTHSVGHIRVSCPVPLARLLASIGVDNNQRTEGKRGSVVFSVSADGRPRYKSAVLRAGQEAVPIDVDLAGATRLDLEVGDAGDDPFWDHADWAEARVLTRDGKTLWLDALPSRTETRLARYPFSFLYGGRHSDELVPSWRIERDTTKLDADRTRLTTTWTDPASGLRVQWQVTRFADFPALDWVIYLENSGRADTQVLADVQALDLALDEPIGSPGGYRFHRTAGAPSNPTDFEPTLVEMRPGDAQRLSGGGGRSSNKDFPFLKIESAAASYILAIGWSGQWAAHLTCREDGKLHLAAGLERTHFLLHPGERVRTPRILVLRWPGDTLKKGTVPIGRNGPEGASHQWGLSPFSPRDTLESNAQFRQLLYKHYVARRNGQRPLPTLFCNTCFTRGGGWLNECNAQNQISLIRAYAPLGLEALITDAGWFEGGWPAGAGNWTPRKDAYPQGMGPVAAAARQHGMVYGLWFEFERVVANTWLQRNRPQWLLAAGDGPQHTYLLNLGLPEVREHLVTIVKGFMDLPGFRFYRSDFNMDPLAYWRHTDLPDRQGITEMKYIEGLYDFWDRLARTWPDALREECASGGRRMDLETISRMHLHQESDYWFDNEVDLAVVWSLSRYLPNNTFTTPLVRLDDRSFHATLATSLIPGWIADDPKFDTVRAKQLTDAYLQLRHLLIGAYYPLTEYSRDGKHWMALQFHRPDLGEGLVLVVPPKQAGAAAPAAKVAPTKPGEKIGPAAPVGPAHVGLALHGLEPGATYELHWQVANRRTAAQGSELMKRLDAGVPPGDGGERIVYRRVEGP